MANMGLLGIPVMEVPGMQDAKVQACGMNNYVVTVGETSKEDYDAYLTLLEQCGFEKYAENKDGIDGRVFSATFTKEQFVLTVAYYLNIEETSISFYQHIPLSERLRYNDSYVADIGEDAKTKLYMMELYAFGNSFVFQLKNGHFVISDGGIDKDCVYLLDFLEEHAPEGEKPVVEGWIITHGHGDHTGALHHLFDDTQWLDRIYVEGIYYNQPSERVTKACLCGELECNAMKWVAKHMKKPNGEPTGFYRPQTGQRYYFCDMTMDVLLCQEQVPFEDYGDDINNASTVCMFTVEGQKCFFSGDIHEPGFHWMIQNYSKEYLTLDFFTLNHHGFNTSDEFTDYSTIQTLLVTSRGATPIRTRRKVEYLKSKCKEVIDWGDGTKVFTFPYTIGSVETLAKNPWKHHPDREKPVRGMTLYTIPGRRYYGTIIEAEGVLFEGEEVLPGAREVLQYIKDGGGKTSVFGSCSTENLMQLLRANQMDGYFDLVMGADMLRAEDLYADAESLPKHLHMDVMPEPENLYEVALLRSELYFGLQEMDKMIVIGHGWDTFDAAYKYGFRSIVVNKEFDEELNRVAAIGIIESIGDMFEIYRARNAIFKPL